MIFNKLINLIGVFLLVFKALSLETALTKPGFIAKFPSSVLPNTFAKFCIIFQNIDQDIFINIYDDIPHVFDELNLKIDSKNTEFCTDILINNLVKEYKIKEISIRGESIDGTYKFNDTKKFTLKTENNFVLIETDKPAYKPSDKVRIRVLALDFSLKPLPIKYDLIYITDPSNSRVNQWEDVHALNGLVDLEMPLSEEPNLGMWWIEIVKEHEKTSSYRASFEVKKYVLPKFEVLLNHKKALSPKDKNITVVVCAKYAHGNKVHGNFTLNSYTKKFSYETYHEIIHKSLVNTTEGKGCVEYFIDLMTLGMDSNSYLNTVYLNATVIEADTNVKANGTSSISISFRTVDIQLIEPNYYKPGLPIHFKLLFIPVDENDNIQNKSIQFILERDGVSFFRKNFTLNENNEIDFTYDPKEDCQHFCDIFEPENKPKSFYLKTILDDKEIPNQYIHHYNYINGIQRNFYIEPWFTPNHGYLQIYKQNHQNSDCDKKLQVKILLRSPKSYYGNLMFQIQARSELILSGHYDQSTKNTILTNVQNQKTEDFVNITFQSHKINKINMNKNETKKEIFEDTYNLEINTLSEMSPEFKIFVFYINDREIVSDLATFKIKKCLKNQVDLSLSSNSTQVARKLEITLTTHPNSVCGLSAIDKSVSFMGNRNLIDIDKIFLSLSQFDLLYDNENAYSSTEDECEEHQHPSFPIPRPLRLLPSPVETKIKRGFPSRIFRYSQFYDATKALRESRLIYLTDYGIYQDCNHNIPTFYAMPRSGSGFRMNNNRVMESMIATAKFDEPRLMADGPTVQATSVMSDLGSVTVSETVRDFFPETWLWNINIADEKGKVVYKEKTPDTITDWIFDSYCLSKEKGIGISKTKTLKVFQPLFVTIDMPYSVIKGEVFKVKASLFNYEKTCLPVQMDISNDKRLYVKRSSIRSAKFCICPDNKVTNEFALEALDFEMENGLNITIKARTLNQSDLCSTIKENITRILRFSDIETRSIKVEPEGIQKEFTKSIFAVFKTSQQLTTTLKYDFPKNIVPKSSRVLVKVTGDISGPVLNNLDNLVQQPTGCGEQNMVKFAPIISVLNYLKKTFQLTNDMDLKTKEYLKIGYQRQLTYRHDDGSFSAFGPNSSKENGGTWLTAFVLRCFSDAYKLNQIKIDESDIKKSLNMLLNIQNEDGSFDQVGAALLSKALAGGLSNKKIGLSAYVIISILKAVDALGLRDSQHEKEKLNKGLKYLKNEVQSVEELDTYTLAITLYTFKLANYDEISTIEDLLSELDSRAINENGFIYWTENRNKQNTKKLLFNPSADLEITSYVLLARLIEVDDDLESIAPIVKWINSQRNSLGGFYSTQDTVVALDALSKFSSSFYSKHINLDVKFVENKKTYLINERNRLLIQSFRIENFKENETNYVNLDLKGFGTGLVQLVVKYSLIEENKIKKFDFSVTPSKSLDCKNSKLKIRAKYIGDEESSSMVIVSIRLQSGWVPIEESITKLIGNTELRRYELNENKIFLYFDRLTKLEKEFEISILKKFNIQNIRPGHISVYDYYESIDDSVTQQFEVEEDC